MIAMKYNRPWAIISLLFVLALLALVALLALGPPPGSAANLHSESAGAITPGQNAAILGAHLLLLEGQHTQAIYLPLISN